MFGFFFVSHVLERHSTFIIFPGKRQRIFRSYFFINLVHGRKEGVFSVRCGKKKRWQFNWIPIFFLGDSQVVCKLFLWTHVCTVFFYTKSHSQLHFQTATTLEIQSYTITQTVEEISHISVITYRSLIYTSLIQGHQRGFVPLWSQTFVCFIKLLDYWCAKCLHRWL